MQNQDFTIQPMQPDDTPHLLKIWLDASLIAHAFIGEAKLLEQRDLVEHKYLPMAETWVACSDEKPVGFISLLGNFVGGLFVHPDEQGSGVGRRLVTHAATLKGELMLEVYTANSSAVSFYTAMGFAEISRRDVDDDGLPLENARLRRPA